MNEPTLYEINQWWQFLNKTQKRVAYDQGTAPFNGIFSLVPNISGLTLSEIAASRGK